MLSGVSCNLRMPAVLSPSGGLSCPVLATRAVGASAAASKGSPCMGVGGLRSWWLWGPGLTLQGHIGHLTNGRGGERSQPRGLSLATLWLTRSLWPWGCGLCNLC